MDEIKYLVIQKTEAKDKIIKILKVSAYYFVMYMLFHLIVKNMVKIGVIAAEESFVNFFRGIDYFLYIMIFILLIVLFADMNTCYSQIRKIRDGKVEFVETTKKEILKRAIEDDEYEVSVFLVRSLLPDEKDDSKQMIALVTGPKSERAEVTAAFQGKEAENIKKLLGGNL